MRTSTFVAGLCAAGAIALAKSGFPRRFGLTRSEAAVSLPGDLVYPTASVVADRAVRLSASPDKVWATLIAVLGQSGGLPCYLEPVISLIGQSPASPTANSRAGFTGDVGQILSFPFHRAVTVRVSSPGAALVLVAPAAIPDGRDGDEGDKDQLFSDVALSVAFVLLPSADGRTVLHIRERYCPENLTTRLKNEVFLAPSAVTVAHVLYRVRKAIAATA